MHAWLAILVTIGLALAFSVVFSRMSGVLGPKRPTASKLSVYECGMPPLGDTHHRFSVRFYLVAVLFILFDLEAVFLYPWAATFRRFVASGDGVAVLVEMGLFLGVLFLGWLYVVRRGALDWD